MVYTQRKDISLTVVAHPRQMDSHNPPTGGECGLLEYDSVVGKYFFFLAVRFSFQLIPYHTQATLDSFWIYQAAYSSLSNCPDIWLRC